MAAADRGQHPPRAGACRHDAAGEAASTGRAIYKVSTSRNPLRLRSGTGTKYRVLGKYKKGTQVIVLSTANSSWYEVSCPDGKRGYMASEYLTYVRTEATSGLAAKAVIESRQLRDQPFRIYRAVPELTKSLYMPGTCSMTCSTT
jgi:uncharacterized protein YgiM (DUF1202 family)